MAIHIIESGPVDMVLIEFKGNQFKGEIAPALADLAASGLIRVLDLLFVYRDFDGAIGSLEIGGLGADLDPAFADLDGQLGGGLFDAEDVEEVGEALEPGNSVLVLAVENLWAIPFISAVRNADGEVLEHVRVPAVVVDEVRKSIAQTV